MEKLREEKLETNNKINTGIPTQDFQRKRGRPKKSEQGIAKPSSKKRGRPRKYPVQPPKPTGRRGRPKNSEEIAELESKEQEKPIRKEALTSKQMEEKLRKERKLQAKEEKKQAKKRKKIYTEQEFGAPRGGRKNFQIRKLLFIILLIAFIVSAFVVIRWYYRTSNTARKYENVASKVVLLGKKDENAESNFDTINFQELKTINADSVAWIKIDGTNINYPVMQTTNNEFYLSNDIYKKPDQCGSIYMDYQNDKRIVDKNTVLYGHHIKRGIMFAELEKIYSGELGDDVDIYIYTPEKSMKFKVFSSYKSIPEEFSINTEITEKEYDQFVETLKNKSEKEFIGKPDKSNQILTLSTCDKTGKERILVHAELEDIE